MGKTLRAGPHAQGRSGIRSRREGAGGDPAQVSRDAGRARHRHPLDRQGRIYLPPHLRAYGGITRGVTIIGMGNRLEIWSTPLWRTRLRKVVKAPETLAKHLDDLIL